MNWTVMQCHHDFSVPHDRVVYNRSHYAELVYGQFYRGKNPFGKSEVQALDAVVEADGLVIYCDLPVKDIKMRLERRNSTEVLSTDETTLEELTANSAAFEEVFKDRNVIRYRAYTANHLKAVMNKIEKLILEAESP